MAHYSLLLQLVNFNFHPQSQQVPYLSHCTTDISFFCSKESSFLVVTVKKGGLTVNKKTPTGKDRVATRKQGKKNKKGLNPAIRSEGDKPMRMKNHSQSQQTRRNSLDLLAEAVTSVFQGDLSA
jgi:hypothetical protein